MGGLFGKKPKAMPPPVAPPPAPTIDEASASRDAADRATRRKGRAAAVFAGKSGARSTSAVSAAKTLASKNTTGG